MIDVGNFWFDDNVTVDFTNAICAGNGFGQALSRVALCEHRLTLQVRELNKIPIDDAKSSHTRARQSLRLRRIKGATTDDYYARLQKPFLAIFADAVEKNLTAVSLVVCRTRFHHYSMPSRRFTTARITSTFGCLPLHNL